MCVLLDNGKKLKQELLSDSIISNNVFRWPVIAKVILAKFEFAVAAWKT
jgi:hypothetical protein